MGYVVCCRDAEGDSLGRLGAWETCSPVYPTREAAELRQDECNGDGLELCVKSVAECEAAGIEL